MSQQNNIRPFLPGASSLIEQLDTRVLVILRDGRHILGKHSSVATWIVSQKVKSVPLQIRSQANQVFFFDSTKAEKSVVVDEFTPLDKKEGEELMDFVYDKPHNFLFINLFIPKNKRLFKGFNQLILEDYN